MARGEKAVTHGKPLYICSVFEPGVYRGSWSTLHCKDSPALWWQCHRVPAARGLLLPYSLRGTALKLPRREGLLGLRCSVLFTGEKRDL